MLKEPHFGRVPFFILVDMERNKVENVKVVENPGASMFKGKAIKAAHFLLDHNVDVLLVNSLGEGPFYVLRDKLVEIYVIPQPISVREAIDRTKNESLEVLKSPHPHGKQR